MLSLGAAQIKVLSYEVNLAISQMKHKAGRQVAQTFSRQGRESHEIWEDASQSYQRKALNGVRLAWSCWLQQIDLYAPWSAPL